MKKTISHEWFLSLIADIRIVIDVLVENNLISNADFVARRDKFYDKLDSLSVHDDKEKDLNIAD